MYISIAFHPELLWVNQSGENKQGYSSQEMQDFPELTSIRGMLGAKFGKEFVEKASSDNSCRQFMVNENLIRSAACYPGFANNGLLPQSCGMAKIKPDLWSRTSTQDVSMMAHDTSLLIGSDQISHVNHLEIPRHVHAMTIVFRPVQEFIHLSAVGAIS